MKGKSIYIGMGWKEWTEMVMTPESIVSVV